MRSAKDFILIKGAEVHNLKKIDVAIPRKKLVVITGLSGSGKSSLAFDTLFAEGQRRYVESLSAYARQFLGKIEKPAVQYIKGISPAIAIEQKTRSGNPRSTVGTMTEIYDYLKLLFARVGTTVSPVSGEVVRRDTVEDVVSRIASLSGGVKVEMLAPVSLDNETSVDKQLSLLLQKGFTRLRHKGKALRLEDPGKDLLPGSKVEILIDRFSINEDTPADRDRLSDSTETAFHEGNGSLILAIHREEKVIEEHFSNRFERDGMSFIIPSIHLFSFNNPFGACPACEGFGSVIGIDPEKVIPNKNLSVYEDAVVCWKGDKMSKWKKRLLMHAEEFGFPVHRPYSELTQEQQRLLWEGNKHFRGLNAFFKYLEKKQYKIQYRVMLSRYRGRTPCPECGGSRLRKEATYVKIAGKSITDILDMQVDEVLLFFKTMDLTEHEKSVAERITKEIINRLSYLCDAGLGYLCLNRQISTLSGGEFQRVTLAGTLGNNLSGSIYILDEPSVGLHPVDTERLMNILRFLRQLGNTVVVVEHEEEIIRSADTVIDLGPGAGTGGGKVMYQGDLKGLMKSTNSLTAQYLREEKCIKLPPARRMWKKSISIKGASENNLRKIDVDIPLGVMTVVCGVSGSGKSSLVIDVLSKGLYNALGISTIKPGSFSEITGDIEAISGVEVVDQSPIGKSSRSNPVTYLKAFDEIRELYSRQRESKIHGYKPSFFSFNVDGGRCDACQGEGETIVEMQFMADVRLKCDVCKGQRYKDEILDVKYRGKNIYDLLQMTVDEAMDFFKSDGAEKKSLQKRICQKLQPLLEVGLGYLPMGQASSTLSGGEAQRIKLASFLSANVPAGANKMMFIFDEPTTGLHFHDIGKLMDSFNALIGRGHSVIIIEHNVEVIKCADWVLELGPGGGRNGGELLYAGRPEDLLHCPDSRTAEFLHSKLPVD